MSDKKNPYSGTKTEQNLLAAFAGESQARNKYTYYASKAKKEGFEQISALFLKTAENEKEHAKLWFKELNGIGTTAENLADALLEPLCTKELVLCCEVGSGVIPLSREERQAREATGRLCVLLAQRADAVVRMVAGIPTAIKGVLPCGRI